MSLAIPLPIHGRGTDANPQNRFERLHVEDDFEHFETIDPEDDTLDRKARPKTHYFADTSKTIIAENDSPDVPFTHSVNPYRGCAHGCIYCFARPSHEYLGFSAGLDFETKIMVKPDAPALLRKAFSSPKWQPTRLAMSGVTDCYQPIEKQLRLTRGCLEICNEFRNPANIITKNHLVTRDLDILADMAKWNGTAVFISITTLDANLTRVMEPRTSVPKRRLEAIRKLADAGVPVGVMVAPIIPGLTDHETPAILEAAAAAGATSAGYVALRLPWAVAPLFDRWLDQHFPDRKLKILNRIRSLRGGKLYDARWGARMKGEGLWADQMKTMFEAGLRKSGMKKRDTQLSPDHFRRPGNAQLSLW